MNARISIVSIAAFFAMMTLQSSAFAEYLRLDDSNVVSYKCMDVKNSKSVYSTLVVSGKPDEKGTLTQIQVSALNESPNERKDLFYNYGGSFEIDLDQTNNTRYLNSSGTLASKPKDKFYTGESSLAIQSFANGQNMTLANSHMHMKFRLKDDKATGALSMTDTTVVDPTSNTVVSLYHRNVDAKTPLFPAKAMKCTLMSASDEAVGRQTSFLNLKLGTHPAVNIQ